MRRHLPLCSALLATAAASLGLSAGAVAATSPATTASVASASATPTTTTTTTTTPTTTTTKRTTPPTAPAVNASVRLILSGVYFVHHDAVIVPGRAMRLTGQVRPYVAGQTVTLELFLGRHRTEQTVYRLKPSAHKRYGRFTATIAAARAGILHINVVHARTAQMRGFTKSRGVASLNPDVGFGARGAFVELIQRKLAAVHMYIPQTGVFDQKTGLAIDAYHRLLGHGTSQSLDAQTVSELLDGRGRFRVRYPHDGKHVEGDLGNQLLALIDGSKVQAIYPISSGKPSTPTILGRFHVYLRTPGYLPDGMYYSDFFTGGYAIHGYDPAPDYPASHGCMRLPIVDAISVWNWLSIGVAVDTYE